MKKLIMAALLAMMVCASCATLSSGEAGRGLEKQQNAFMTRHDV